MRKALITVMAVALLGTACGGESSAAPKDPDQIDNCEELADATIGVVQGVIDMIGDLDAAGMAAMMGGEMPPGMAELEAAGDAITVRSAELGCTDFGALLQARAGNLVASDTNAIGKMIIGSVQAGEEDVFARLSR